METKDRKTNWLYGSRYVSAMWNNAYRTREISYNVVASSYSWEHALTISYAKLQTHIQDHFGLGENSNAAANSRGQQYKNHISALSTFLAFNGKTLDANVGIELGSEFDERLSAFLSAIEISDRSKRDRASQLKAIRGIYQRQTKLPFSVLPKRTGLSEALRIAVAKSGLPAKQLAIQCEVPPANLQRWLNGASLNRRGYPSLRRLETALGLPRDFLVSLANEAKEPVENKVPVKIPAFRQRMKEFRSTSYNVKLEELSAEFLNEWWALFRYKLLKNPSLKSHAKGEWRLLPKGQVRKMTELAMFRNMACPTAEMMLRSICRFMGVIKGLPVLEGGLGLEADFKQTLAWFACPDALRAYLDWTHSRAEGRLNSGHRVFAQAIASLLRPDTGYLWQQPTEFIKKLPVAYQVSSADEWRSACATCHAMLLAVKRNSKDCSRLPTEPIEHLLALDEPLKPLLDAVKKIDMAAAECVPGSYSQARHKRNALLLALLITNPLRERSLASLTWSPDGGGSFRGATDTGWRIVLDASQLKNGKSSLSEKYDVKVATWLTSRVDEYLTEFRGVLLKGQESKYFFVGSKDCGLWEGVSDTVFKLTKEYIPGSPGFGSHAVRHLVATDWLRRHPADYLTVSKLLNDRLETVIKCYAHLERDDSFLKYEEHLERVMAAK